MVDTLDCLETLKEMAVKCEGGEVLTAILGDAEFNGRINYHLYLATILDRRRHLRREAARAVFNNFDIDKNGNISLYEIAQALGKHEEISLGKVTTVSYKEVQKIWLEMRLVFAVQPGQHLDDKEMTF